MSGRWLFLLQLLFLKVDFNFTVKTLIQILKSEYYFSFLWNHRYATNEQHFADERSWTLKQIKSFRIADIQIHQFHINLASYYFGSTVVNYRIVAR